MLLKLNVKKSTGPDNIPNNFLRRYAEQIAPFLTRLFMLSLNSGVIPDDWRIARIVPVHKKGDRLDYANYRPVSITSACSKLMEHVVANYIKDFLAHRSLLTPCQHGFRKGMSTTTQLVLTVNEIAQVLDKSGQVDMLCLDFSKAFDKVPHAELIYKLKCLNLPLPIVRWISDYLRNRKQFVEIKNCASRVLPVTSGVPQGSVLGPLLFLIYVNDLVDVVPEDVTIKLFADDCIILKEIVSEDSHIALQKSLRGINEWCTRWGMVLNSDKTVLLRVTRKKHPSIYTYVLHDKPVLEVSKYKYLGVTFTNKLTWSEHISDISKSALRKLWFLKRRLKNGPVSTRLLAYNVCIRSKLEYAAVVWDSFTKKDSQQLENIQRKAVRFIFSKYKRCDSPTSLMKLNNIPTLEARRKINRLSFLHDCITGKLKITLPQIVKPLITRTTRHSHKCALTPIFARTTAFKNSFFPRVVSEWNLLPPDVFESGRFFQELERLFLFA